MDIHSVEEEPALEEQVQEPALEEQVQNSVVRVAETVVDVSWVLFAVLGVYTAGHLVVLHRPESELEAACFAETAERPNLALDFEQVCFGEVPETFLAIQDIEQVAVWAVYVAVEKVLVKKDQGQQPLKLLVLVRMDQVFQTLSQLQVEKLTRHQRDQLSLVHNYLVACFELAGLLACQPYFAQQQHEGHFGPDLCSWD